MGPLPNFGNAEIGIEKIQDYVLNINHADGQHKARVFKSLLGIGREHSPAFVAIIRNTLKDAPAQFVQRTEYGEQWTTWHEIIGMQGQYVIITVGWIFRQDDQSVPRLVTCYIETGEQDKLKRLLASYRIEK